MICVVFLSGISQAAELTGKPVPDKVRKVLVEILDSAGAPSAEVTSVERTTTEQATIMFDYYLKQGASNCASKKSCSCETFEGRVLCAKGFYCEIGDKAIETVLSSDARDQAIAKMKTFFDENLKPDRACLMHVVTNPPPMNFAVDIAPSSIHGFEEAFVKAVEANGSVDKKRFFRPGKSEETAYHIEIPR